MADMTDSRLRRLPAFVWGNIGETGRVSVVTGASNSGIRDVVDDVCRLAAEDGAAVLRRTAAWLESELPFALFCQLISGLDVPAELADSAHELIESSLSSGDGLVAEYRGLRAIQGLCDLLMTGASGRRLLVVVDDAQFIDAWSLRCLLSLVPRLRSAGMGLVVSGLPPLGATNPHWLSELLRAPGTRSFQVSPLTEHDIGELAYELGLRPTAWLMMLPALSQHFMVIGLLRAEPVPTLYAVLSVSVSLVLGAMAAYAAGRLYHREALLG